MANVDAGTLQDTRPLADQLAESLAVIRKETGKGGGSSRTSLIRDAKVRYRPMWHVKQKSISLYRCMLDTQSGSKALEHFKGMDNSNEMQMAVADLDYLVFARALKGLHALLQKKGAAIFVIPVHFRTIATKEKRKEYLKICESIPEPYRQFVAFEIYGLMANTPISRVEQFIHVLKPFCKALAIELPVNYQWIDKLANNNLWAISFDFAQTADKDAFKMPVKIVRAQSLRTIAHGVNSHNSLDTAVDTGFDYIDGTVVVGNVVTPRGTFKFSPERPPAPPTPALSR